ncbi:MAG: polysaccharide biosynthesis protein [Nostoc sp.]|uniref:polysaccharide biosynthesis protein n=1 Tax=Nostoc sp. TaxID=1180 RepID=UPI002FFC9432
MHRRYAKAFYWLKILTKYISVQLIVQLLNVSSGILLVRALTKEEYAYLTLANSLQATMNIFADSGISSALSAIGGRVWQDPYRFGQLINTAMQWRRYLAAIAIAVVTPILFWMLLQNGASVYYTILLTAAILIELNYYLTSGVLEIVPRLHSQIDRIQRLNLLSASSRILILLGSSIFFLNAAVGAFASTISSGLSNLLLWHWVKDTVDIKAPINREDQVEILKLVKAQAPTSIFFSVQGQLTVWLISTFGKTQNIAEVGALSRLSIMFSIVNSIMANIVIPSFARCQSRQLLLRRYWQILIAYFLLATCLIIITFLYPQQFISIIGSQYANLNDEVSLTMLSANTGFLSGLLWSINVSKGWIQDAWLYIPATIATQILLLFVLDVSTVKGVIYFGMYSQLPSLVINFYMNYKGFKSFQR